MPFSPVVAAPAWCPVERAPGEEGIVVPTYHKERPVPEIDGQTTIDDEVEVDFLTGVTCNLDAPEDCEACQ